MKHRSIYLIIFLIIVIFSNVRVRCSQIGISANFGYNTFAMDDLRLLTDSYIRTYQFKHIPVQVFSKFPSYYYFGFQIENRFWGNKAIGLNFMYTSTGSRVHYGDYSGELKLDQMIELFSIGPAFAFKIKTFKSIDIWICAALNYQYSKLHYYNLLTISNDTSLDDIIYNAKGWEFYPKISLRYPFKIFEISLDFFYRLSHSGLLVDFNDDSHYLTSYHQKLKPNWSGFGMGLSFYLLWK